MSKRIAQRHLRTFVLDIKCALPFDAWSAGAGRGRAAPETAEVRSGLVRYASGGLLAAAAAAANVPTGLELGARVSFAKGRVGCAGSWWVPRRSSATCGAAFGCCGRRGSGS